MVTSRKYFSQNFFQFFCSGYCITFPVVLPCKFANFLGMLTSWKLCMYDSVFFGQKLAFMQNALLYTKTAVIPHVLCTINVK